MNYSESIENVIHWEMAGAQKKNQFTNTYSTREMCRIEKVREKKNCQKKNIKLLHDIHGREHDLISIFFFLQRDMHLSLIAVCRLICNWMRAACESH